VKIRRKALPVDYYFYNDDQEFPAYSNNTNPHAAVPMQQRGDNVVVTVMPMVNGRVRETAGSIPEEPDTSPQHCNSELLLSRLRANSMVYTVLCCIVLYYIALCFVVLINTC